MDREGESIFLSAGVAGRLAVCLVRDEQADADEDQHDGEYRLERLARQPRGDAAADEDAGYAAQKERPGEPEVHVALGHVGEAHDEREYRSGLCPSRRRSQGRAGRGAGG